jgi:cardiolipin synthase (CMP-forming)
MIRRYFSIIASRCKQEPILTLPTIVTLIRLALIPAIIISMVLHHWGTAFLLFIIASITDGIDGALARLLDEKTFFGAALDALTDKVLIVSCFITLAFVRTPLFVIPLWFVGVVLLKEIVLISGTIYLLCAKEDVEISPTTLGKSTMCMQVGFIIWLFACYFFHWLPLKTYYGMLGLLLFFVVASLYQYIIIGKRYLLG